MTIYYKTENRKPLVQAVSEFTGARAVYMRTPTYAYKIDYFTVTREGNLEFDDSVDSQVIENLIEFLASKGFTAKETPDTATENNTDEVIEETDTEPQSKDVGLTVAIPIDKVKIENLTALLNSKGSLIKKALGIDNLNIKEQENKVLFPWFLKNIDEENIQTYTKFISALCEMSVKQKRINNTENHVTNEKYFFRCFLLRLGFIGPEFKADRKILLKNLKGSSAFKNGVKEANDNELSL